jgi:membrane protein required for colicin V production
MYYLALAIVIIVFIWRIVAGFKKGMVEEIISIISILIAAAALAVILIGIGNYLDEQLGDVLKMFLILALLIIVYKVVNVIFTSLKLISKLPVIGILNRILGAALGAVEAVVIILILIQVLKHFSISLPTAI